MKLTGERTMKTSWAFALLSAIMLALGAVPASAQANRTWVSGTGTDSGTCTIAAPCASFQYALSQTKAGGEIDCLTPGDFGGNAGPGLYINQSVSIVCDGVSNGGILFKGTNPAIIINAGSGAVVYLSGLDLEGAGTGIQGVNIASGSLVYIVHCSIRGFTEYGVLVASDTTTRVVIKDSVVVKDGTGISVYSVGDVSNAASTVNSVIDGNPYYAAMANGTSGPNAIALIKTLATGSTDGLALLGGASGTLIGPSNTIAGTIEGSPTSLPFK
jgi:hypothetical protein